jgi:hypothetical protein
MMMDMMIILIMMSARSSQRLIGRPTDLKVKTTSMQLKRFNRYSEF